MEKVVLKSWTEYGETGWNKIVLKDNNAISHWKTILDYQLDASESLIALKTQKQIWTQQANLEY